MTTFSAEVFQNEYLPAGADVVDAVVTVTVSGHVATRTAAYEIIIMDLSGSMNEEGGAKLRAARAAMAAAVDSLRDDVNFAIVGGREHAYQVFPQRGFAVATPNTKEEAKKIARSIAAEGGTAIGRWLDGATGLFHPHRGSICHAILLTDGKNQHQQPWELDQAIGRASSVFECDCRGLGTDWNVADLRKIASALQGTVDIIPEPDEMVAEFTALVEHAMGKEVAGAALRLWVPQGAELEFIRQVSPNLVDLTAGGVAVSPLMKDYVLPAWSSDESRDYHVRVKIPTGKVGDERLAARVMLMVGEDQITNALIRAVWTDDTALSTRINREVAHYTGQAELADAIAAGLSAREAGDADTATVKLGRAVQLAHEAGNDDTVKLLQKVVEIDDPEKGTVRLKGKVAAADAMALDVRSTRTVRVNQKK